MKIGIVLPNVPAYSETFFNNKIKGLENYGYKTILFVNSNSGNSNFKNLKVAPNFSRNKIYNLFLSIKYFFQSILFHFPATKKLFLLNKKDNFSIIDNLKNIISNSHILSQKVDWLHFGYGTMAIGRENVAQAIGAKMAVSFRGFDHYVFPVKNKKCYDLLFSKNVKYHVLSSGMKDSLVLQKINSDKIIKITPAIDINLFDSKTTNTNTQTINLVTISRLHWIKGIEYTLEALSILKQNNINFHYTIIGDGIEKERLQFAVYQLGLIDNVTFAGKLSSVEIKTELEKSNLYIQYSIQEGFCNAVLEAQAMGKICIVSDAEGLSENVINNETGFVVEKRKPLHLANKIIEVLNMPEFDKNKISSQAIHRVKNQFNLENQIEQFITFYTK
jgi:glycosyltransferase involved in cell wall biosynthesis